MKKNHEKFSVSHRSLSPEILLDSFLIWRALSLRSVPLFEKEGAGEIFSVTHHTIFFQVLQPNSQKLLYRKIAKLLILRSPYNYLLTDLLFSLLHCSAALHPALSPVLLSYIKNQR